MRLQAALHRLIGYFRPFDWRHMLVAAPGMAACLIYGLVTHDTLTGAIAAGSAFSVGFGLRRYRQTRSMLGCVALMTAAAFIGSLTAGNFALYMILMAGAAAACACFALIDDDLWWVALQATIALLLASHYAGDLHAALARAGVVMAAGLFQMLCVVALRLIPLGHPQAVLTTPIPATKRALLAYGGVAALSVVCAMLIAYGLHMDKAYWAPMTALIILKPKYHLTRQRGFERLMGNVLGCAIATGITFVIPQTLMTHASLDVLLCVLGSGASYALIKARYAAFSLAVSFTVVMLLYSAHASALAGSEQRIYATVIGGLVSIAVMWLASRTVARDYAM
jgi:hypothetical protein